MPFQDLGIKRKIIYKYFNKIPNKPDERETCHEHLKQGDTEYDEVYGRSVDTLVDLAGSIDKSQVVLVNKMFKDEVGQTKGCYKRTRYAVHDDHCKQEKHSSILLSEPGGKIVII